jgi:hypothetical protein
MIYFDLDGVIRDLKTPLRGGDYPSKWEAKMPNGDDVLVYITKNLHILKEAPVTEYFDVIKKYASKNNHITIITRQLRDWRKFTNQWLDEHFENYTVIYVDRPQDKIKYIKPHDFLVEDFPKFEPWDYQRIILIDRPYNESINDEFCFARVKKPEDLDCVLDEIYSNNLHLL